MYISKIKLRMVTEIKQFCFEPLQVCVCEVKQFCFEPLQVCICEVKLACFSSTSSIIMKHFKFGMSSSSCVSFTSASFTSSCCSSFLSNDSDCVNDLTPVWNIFSSKSIGTNVSSFVKIYRNTGKKCNKH